MNKDLEKKTTTRLPKKIWFLWLQGYDDMPEVVRRSYESWHKYNGSWEIIFLDADNFKNYIDVSSLLENRQQPIPRVTLSEIIRINLMKEHGGVWVDATCFCCKPLDDWLPQHLDTGFFAFDRPGIDRMISSWFLASEKGNSLATTYADTVNAFWQSHRGLVFVPKKPWLQRIIVRSGLYQFLKRNTHWWFSFPFTRIFQVYPYYWFHYTFGKLYRENAAFRKQWEATPKISADSPHRLWNVGLAEKITPELKENIDQRVDPLYKLTWKVEASMFLPGSGLDYLLYHSKHLDA